MIRIGHETKHKDWGIACNTPWGAGLIVGGNEEEWLVMLYAVDIVPRHRPKNSAGFIFRMFSRKDEVMAKRIQRKRTKGWRMPENTVYVGRPTKWGNPFKDDVDWVLVNANYRRKVLSPWVVYCNKSDATAAQLFRLLLFDLNSVEIEEPIREKFKLMRDRIMDLRGVDLACWCPLDQPCHADVLLELANS